MYCVEATNLAPLDPRFKNARPPVHSIRADTGPMVPTIGPSFYQDIDGDKSHLKIEWRSHPKRRTTSGSRPTRNTGLETQSVFDAVDKRDPRTLSPVANRAEEHYEVGASRLQIVLRSAPRWVRETFAIELCHIDSRATGLDRCNCRMGRVDAL
jgi:hypothetical protein